MVYKFLDKNLSANGIKKIIYFKQKIRWKVTQTNH